MIPFNEAKERIRIFLQGRGDLTIPTLGGQAAIIVRLQDSDIVFYNTRGNLFIINERQWDAVYRRRNSLPANIKNQTSQYGDPRWAEMPNFLNYILAPYIPAIMRFLEENDLPPNRGNNLPPDTPDPDPAPVSPEPTNNDRDPYENIVIGRV